MTDRVLLEVTDLQKRYGNVDALRGVSLRVCPGEVLALLGPNGAGKTTLLSIIAGLRFADGGTVVVDGASARPGRGGKVGYAPQDLGVYPVLSVAENLRFFGALTGARGSALDAEVSSVAALLRLTDLLDRRVRTLSGGQQRRVHTAAALLGRPPLLLLDEPTAGVDVETRAAILDGVRALAAGGTAICYATHYLAEVEALQSRVAILHDGLVAAQGSIAELTTAVFGESVELRFDGQAPSPPLPTAAEADGDMLRIQGTVRGRDLLRVLSALGSELDRLRSVERVRPTLESVYLSVTTGTNGKIREPHAAP